MEESISVVHSHNGLGGDVRGRRHCAHGAKHERVKTKKWLHMLTQKKKLRMKSIYLMHMVQPSTPIVRRSDEQDLRRPWLKNSGVRRIQASTARLLETHTDTHHTARKRGNTQLLPHSLFSLPPSVRFALPLCTPFPSKVYCSAHFL